jgi:hypothetical protein
MRFLSVLFASLLACGVQAAELERSEQSADMLSFNLAAAKTAAANGQVQLISHESLEKIELDRDRAKLVNGNNFELTFTKPLSGFSVKLQDARADSVFKLSWFRGQFELGSELFGPALLGLPGVSKMPDGRLAIAPDKAFDRIVIQEVQGNIIDDIEYLSDVEALAADQTNGLDTNIKAFACQLPLGIAFNASFVTGLLAIDPITAGISDAAGYTANLALKFCKTVLEAPPDLTGRVNDGDCAKPVYQPHMVSEYENALGIPLVFEYDWGELGTPLVYHHNTEVEVGMYFGNPTPPKAGKLDLKILIEDAALTTDATDLIYQQCTNDGRVATSQLNGQGKEYACPYYSDRIIQFPVGRNTVLWRANTKMGPLDMLPMSLPGTPAGAKSRPYKTFLENVAKEVLRIGTDTYLLNGWRWGNVHDDYQVVTVFDEIPPTISPNPVDQTRITTEVINNIIHVQIEADEPGGVSQRNYERILSRMYDVSDTCDRPVSFNAQYPTDALRSFWPVSTQSEDNTFSITWTARDPGPNLVDLANETTTTMVVEVVDIRAPAIVPPPDIVEVDTGQVSELGNPLVFDFVDLNPDISNDASLPLGLGLHEVTWTATDASGNSSQAVQLVNVKNSNLSPSAIAQSGSNRRQAISFEPTKIRLRGDDPDDDPLRFYIKQHPADGFFVAPLYPYFVEDYRLQQSASDAELTAACNGDTGPGTGPSFDLNFPSTPKFMSVDDSGASYVVDSGYISCSSLYDDKFRRQQRIAKFGADGQLIVSEELGNDTMSDVIVDKNLDRIYLTRNSSSGASFILVFDSDLNELEGYRLSNLRNRATNSCGNTNGPCDILNARSALVDANGILYVMDNRGLIYALVKGSGIASLFVDYVSDKGASSYPQDSLALDSKGLLYATRNNRIYQYNGSFIANDGLAYPGELNGWLGRCDIDLAAGDEAVCDVRNHRSIGFSCTDDICAIDDAATQGEKDFCGFTFSNKGNFGCRPGQFYSPGGIDLDLRDNIYVADSGNERVQRFSPEGYFAGEAQSSCDGSCFVLGDFGNPRDVSVNSDHFYILDPATNLLHVSLLTPFTDIGPDWAELVYQSNNEFACNNSSNCIDSFGFSVSDGVRNPTTGLPTRSAPATVQVEVSRNFRPPVATPGIAAVVLEDELTPITLDGAELDPLDSLSFILTTPPEYGTVNIVGNQANYLSDQDYVGEDSFAFAADDGFESSAPEVVGITVLNINDAPLVGEIEDTTIGAGFTYQLAHHFNDPDIDEIHLLNIDWGDGTIEPEGNIDAMGNASGPQLHESDNGVGRISADHVYSSPGLRTLNVCVTDQISVASGNKLPTTDSLIDCKQATINVIDALDVVLSANPSKDSVLPGDFLTYEFEVTNLTPISGSGKTATGVELKVELSRRLDNASISMSGNGCSRNDYSISCNIGSLSVGSSSSLSVTAQVPFTTEPGLVLQTPVKVTLNETDQTPENSLLQITPVIRQGDFYVGSTGDAFLDKPDANPFDGVCASEDGVCTLRAAIEQSESTSGQQVIVLGNGTYRLETVLPGIKDDLILIGNGAAATILDAADLGAAMIVESAGTLRLEGMTIANAVGSALLNSGSTTVRRVRFTNNYARFNFGGAIQNSGDLDLRDVSFDGNRSDNDGGAVWSSSSSTSTMVNVTAVGNINSAFAFVGGTHSLTNVTIIGNTGGTGWEAPAAALNVYGANTSVTLQNTALISNRIGPYGGAPNCVALTGSQLISLGHNLFGDLQGCDISLQGTDIVSDDAGLLPAADNGMGLPTLRPRESSLMVDSGSATACPDADARGIARPADGNDDGIARCDIGAYELQNELLFGSGFEQ